MDVEAGQLGVPQQLEEGGVTALQVHAAEDHPRGRPDLLDQPGVVRGPLGVQDEVQLPKLVVTNTFFSSISLIKRKRANTNFKNFEMKKKKNVC